MDYLNYNCEIGYNNISNININNINNYFIIAFINKLSIITYVVDFMNIFNGFQLKITLSKV